MATGDPHIKLRADRSSGSRDMLTDRQTHRQTDIRTDRNILHPLYRGGVTRAHRQRGTCLHADTDRQTDRRVDLNIPHPYRGGVVLVTAVLLLRAWARY